MTAVRVLIAALAGAAISCSPESPEAASVDADPGAALSGRLVRLSTSAGNMVLELDPEKAPISVANFLGYVDRGHYDGTIFHRVIDGYLIEGGSVTPADGALVEKPTGDPVESESRNGLTNLRGTVAMARASDPGSARAAFFINLSDNIGLDYPQPDGHGFTVFGKVISGIEVLDRIGGQATTTRSLTLIHPATGEPDPRDVADVPLDPVLIVSAKRAERETVAD